MTSTSNVPIVFWQVTVIDQHKLPHVFTTITAKTAEDMAVIIKDMHIRGAGLVGASAGAGMVRSNV